MVRRALLALLMPLVACTGEERFFLELPSDAMTHAIVLVVTQGDRIEVRAFSETDDEPFNRPIPQNGNLQVTALLYSEPLEQLEPRLMSGPVEPAEPNESMTPLPEPNAVLVVDNLDEEDADPVWREGTLENYRSIDFLVPGGPCVLFDEVRLIDIGRTVRNPKITLPLKESRGLLTTDLQEWYFIDQFGVTPITDRPPDLPFEGAFIDASNEIWFAGGTGLWRGRVEGDAIVAEVVSSTLGADFRWIDGTTDPGDFELFTLSRRGAFSRFDGVEWTRLFQFASEQTTDKSGVARIGRNHAVAARSGDATLARWKDGELTLENPAFLHAQGPSGLRRVTGVGTLVGGDEGGVSIDRGDRWEPTGDSRFALRIRDFLATQNGFLFAGASGHVGQFHTEAGYCEPQAIGQDTIRAMIPLGEHLVLLPTDLSKRISVVRPRRPLGFR